MAGRRVCVFDAEESVEWGFHIPVDHGTIKISFLCHTWMPQTKNLYVNIPIEGVLSRNYERATSPQSLRIICSMKKKVQDHVSLFVVQKETLLVIFVWHWNQLFDTFSSINFNTDCILFLIWAKANPITFSTIQRISSKAVDLSLLYRLIIFTIFYSISLCKYTEKWIWSLVSR